MIIFHSVPALLGQQWPPDAAAGGKSLKHCAKLFLPSPSSQVNPQPYVHSPFPLLEASAQAVPEECRGRLMGRTWATGPPRRADAGELSSPKDAPVLCRAVTEGERSEQR